MKKTAMKKTVSFVLGLPCKSTNLEVILKTPMQVILGSSCVVSLCLEAPPSKPHCLETVCAAPFDLILKARK